MRKKLHPEVEERALLLRSHLLSGDAGRQRYVGDALSEMSPDEAVDIVMYWLTNGQHILNTTFVAIGVGTGYLALITPILIKLVDWRSFIVPIGLPIYIGAVAISSRNQALRTRSLELLLNFDDLRIINVLVQALARTSQPNGRVSTAQALTKLLNKIKSSDSHHISKQSRKILTEKLLDSKNATFVISILSAWEQIGEAEAIPIVERLSHGEGKAGGDAKVREAACLAIPAIQAAAERAAVSDVLLRPSEFDGSTNELLRPAQSANPADARALLHPTTSPSNTP